MRTASKKNAKIMVFAKEKALADRAVRALLDKAGVATVAVGTTGRLLFADSVLQLASVACGRWCISLIDSDDRSDYAVVVPVLVGGGLDDVIVVGGDQGTAALDHSLARARRTLSLADAIMNSGRVLGTSAAMQAVRKAAARCILSGNLPVLILGETGTGKGQIARAIHDADPQRRARPFHTLDCGGVTDSLLGSELFGHIRGAYTGALTNRRGAFESADEGTLLLDEIGELSLQAQSYLLNALQERRYRPVGSDRTLPIRCRFIAATNSNLADELQHRRFRRDLFYRLSGHCIVIPALRDRASDVPELFSHFLQATTGRETAPAIEPEVVEVLRARAYPGNVRELESIAAQTAAAMGEERLVRLAHLPFEHMSVEQGSTVTGNGVEAMVRKGMRMRDIEAEIARQAIHLALRFRTTEQPNRPRTQIVEDVAKSLGVSPRTVYNKLNGLARPS